MRTTLAFFAILFFTSTAEAQLFRNLFKTRTSSGYSTTSNGYIMGGKEYIRGIHPGRPGCSCAMCQDLNVHYRAARAKGLDDATAKVVAMAEASSLPRETPLEARKFMLAILGLQPGELFCDPGAGLGSLALEAVDNYDVRATAIEINPESARIIQLRAESANLKVRVVADDCLNYSYGHMDAMALYLFPELLDKLEPYFQQMKRGSRIVSYHFPIPNSERINNQYGTFYLRRN